LRCTSGPEAGFGGAGGVQANFASLSRDALPEAAKGKPIEVWFQDEARVGQKGGHAYVWAPIGSRPTMVRDNRHDSAYLYGAICPARRTGAAVIMPAANTEGMNHHLAEISTQVAPGAHAVLLCDGAGWHQRGKRLCVPDNITLVSLPPYAPELVWGLRCQARAFCERVGTPLPICGGGGIHGWIVFEGPARPRAGGG
jgi:hypothetical protein